MIRPLALAGISAAILAYEVLLVRLFAIVQWHHFAFMAISIALLGFGVSGTLIVVFRQLAERSPRLLFTGASAVFAISAPGAFLLAQLVPFNPLEIVWAPSQLLYLASIFILLTVPFTAGASCIGLAFREPGAVPGQVYFWNLLGSGAGALGIVGALMTLPPMACLALVSVLGFAAALFQAGSEGPRQLVPLTLFAALGAGAWWIAPESWTALRISEFKGLPQALEVSDARVVATRSGPLAALTVVQSPTVPFRHAPGLSFLSPALPPPQLGVFADGVFDTAIDLWDGNVASLAYLDYSPDALVYHMSKPGDVLILEAGGGRLVLQAIAHSAGRIDAVQRNPDMLRLFASELSSRAGHIYDRPEVDLAIADPRHFLTATNRQWDLIQLPPIGSGAAAPARGLNEDFLFTAEGLAQAYSRLRPGGWLSVTSGLELPPRTPFKLIATLRAALALEGSEQPSERIIAIRSTTTLTVLVKRGTISETEIAAARAFAQLRGFDLVNFPGMKIAEANRRIQLAEPVYHQGISALLGPEASDFTARYKFDITAATDDRPYFQDVFRWAALPELLALGPAGGSALIELGELIVTATLLQAMVLGAVLVLWPLRTQLSGRISAGVAWRFGLYFAALGLAFLFIEVAWIQRFVLFLGHPLYSVSVVLTGFLVFAAMGAGFSTVLERRLAGRSLTALDIAVGGIVVVATGYLVVLPVVLAGLTELSAVLRVVATLFMIAPLAFFMGMPFPLGLARISRADTEFVPWAWGLNGCASVVSTAAATLISMHFGISVTLLIGVGLYAAALFLLRRMPVAQDAGGPSPARG